MAELKREVRILKAALDDSPERGGTIIMRGVIHPADLHNLQLDDYQREAEPITPLKKMVVALKNGNSVPDIILGMRGERYRGRDGEYVMLDPIYIIDGQQRRNAAQYVLDSDPTKVIHLGATLHFDTTKEWEREQFHILNANRAKVSPNVLIRNARDDNAAVLTLYGLSHAVGFALKDRVQWGQRMARNELISARAMVLVASSLHSHVSVGSRSSEDSQKHMIGIERLLERVETIGVKAGLNHLRGNVSKFFDYVDEFWGLRTVKHGSLNPHTKSDFLIVLARVFSDHQNFWQGNDPNKQTLFIDADLRRKLKLFESLLRDRGVADLAGSSGPAQRMLYGIIVDHINSGRSRNRLKPRRSVRAMRSEDVDEAA